MTDIPPGPTRPDIVMDNGVNVSFIMKGIDSGGEFGLYRWDVAEQSVTAPPHFHKRITESFFVLDGIVTLMGDGADQEVGPGGFHFVPRDGVHGFRNDHGAASMLILFTPGTPREEYFSLLADRAAGRLNPTPEEWVEICAQHDQYYR